MPAKVRDYEEKVDLMNRVVMHICAESSSMGL